MIAQRFSALGWVAGVATAATALYLVSLQVAAERGRLEAVERQITSAERDMRSLQTELGTRGSMRQLERWNGDVLALSAPRAGQYLKSDAQLAALDASQLGGDASAPPVAMVAVAPAAPVELPAIQHATFDKPAAAPRPEKVALLEPVSLTSIARAAAGERRPRP